MGIFCRICGRPLSNELSVKRGIGPECFKQFGDLPENYEEAERSGVVISGHPFLREGLICIRLGQGAGATAATNIPQLIVRHSPDGFEWGYGGSGPNELALNILYLVSQDLTFAQENHNDFCRTFLAGIPFEGGRVSIGEIMKWVAHRQVYGLREDDHLGGNDQPGMPLGKGLPGVERDNVDAVDMADDEEVNHG